MAEYKHKKYASMFEAIQNKDEEAVKEFEAEAKKGNEIRIM